MLNIMIFVLKLTMNHKNINLYTSKAIANPNRYVFVEKNDWLQLDVNASRKPLLTIPIMVKHFKIAYHEPMS
jgi:hypothetical protein